MNLLLFSAVDRIDDTHIRIQDRRLQHITQVHKAEVGDTLRVGEINGAMGSATILELDNSSALLATVLDTAPPKKLPVTLVLALPRPKMLRRIVRCVAEFGVADLHLINSYRVEKSYWQTPVLSDETLREYLLLGLEQARDTVLPTITCHKRFKPFTQDVLPQLIGSDTALLAHPGDYPRCPHTVTQQTLLVIGPEGGFIPYEVAMLQSAGCQAVSLGPRILRVENAVSSLLGRWQ